MCCNCVKQGVNFEEAQRVFPEAVQLPARCAGAACGLAHVSRPLSRALPCQSMRPAPLAPHPRAVWYSLSPLHILSLHASIAAP